MKILQNVDTMPKPPVLNWPEDTPPDGFLEFPDEYMGIFYPEDKLISGFVDLEVSGVKITNVVWNEAAYQSYIQENPPSYIEPEPTVWDELASAIMEGVNAV